MDENLTELDVATAYELDELNSNIEWVTLLCPEKNETQPEQMQLECSNSTLMLLVELEPYTNSLPLSYRIVATTLHSIIFLWGVFGNGVLINVVRKNSSLHRPTYCYLVSLACADLIVLLSAIPEAIMEHLIGMQWILGQIGCSTLVFLNFLGINAGSLSILAFTMERQMVVLHPMIAQKLCTFQRANRIIALLWISSILCCAPWLGLTEVHPAYEDPRIDMCDFRLSRQQYVIIFAVDTALFYFLPLIVTVIAYLRIANKLKGRSCWHITSGERQDFSDLFSSYSERVTVVYYNPSQYGTVRYGNVAHSLVSYPPVANVRQSLRMLAIVVIAFAVCCLPYRTLLIYNSFQDDKHQFLNIWYLLFAKTLIFLNSAINPTLYNVFSKRFRHAVMRHFRKD